MTRKQLERILAARGLELASDVTGRIGGAWMATVDAIGRNQIDGECRGIAFHDFTANANEFWREIERETRNVSVTPCPLVYCEFHDEQEG